MALPGYLNRTRVAIIPWKENEITYATSPLKLYEYLAMHLPVVVPNLPLLKNIPYVFPSSGQIEFVHNIKIASEVKIDGNEIDRYVRDNSWQARIRVLLQLMRENE